ncbi:extracellular solute-binding protein [Paenibacillaceae bacterium]|nr:extracellular solute-binding protein [Paenibacillaceae bacterium]
MKKLAILCCAFLVTLSITACSTAKNQQNANEGQQSETPAVVSGPLDKYDPPIEVTAVRPIPESITFKEGDNLENNIWSQTLEESLGIKTSYKWMVAQSQYGQKLNISIASDDLPDIFQVTSAQLKKLVEDDQLQDLSELYDTYAAPFTKKILSEDGGIALKSTQFDGKMMALPKMGSGIGQSHLLWVRTDWLNKLDLPEPKTMEDVLQIAEAFTTQDPDGNNVDDTSGLALNRDLWGFFAGLEGFFNGYHAYPNIWVKNDANELVYGSTQPEMKQALQKLQEMFKAGQISTEYGTRDATKVKEDANAGQVGMLYGYFWNSGWLQDGKISDPEAEWVPFPLPSIDGNTAKSQVPFAINTYFVVKKGAKHPEAAIKMLNLVLEKSYGESAEPGKYNVDEEGHSIFEYPLMYGEAPRKNLDAHLHVIEALQNGDTSTLNEEEKGYYDGVTAAASGDVNYWGLNKMYGPGGSLGILNDYATNGNTMDNQFYGAPTDTMVDKDSTLQKMQLEAFTSIIMGDPIDKFDEFVASWKKQGGEKMTNEVNEWYKAQQ